MACNQKTWVLRWFSRVSKGNIWSEVWGYVTFFCLDFVLTGPCFRNFLLSLKLSSSTWVETLAPAEKLGMYCYIHPLRRYQNTAPRLQYCFLTALPLFLHSLPSLIRNFDSVLLESRETLGVWSLFPKNEKWVPQKAFCIHNLEGLTGCCLVSHLNFDLNI